MEASELVDSLNARWNQWNLHLGNVGIALPTLNDYPVKKILVHFGSPECTVVLPLELSHPNSFPTYFVPISITWPKKTPLFMKHLCQDMDFGSGQYFQPHDHGMIWSQYYSLPRRRGVASFPHRTASLRAWTYVWTCRPLGQAPIYSERVTFGLNCRSLACTVRDLFFLCCLYWVAWLVLRISLPNAIVRHRPILRYDMVAGEMAALCAEVPSSWKSYWESKECFHTMRTYSESFLSELVCIGWLLSPRYLSRGRRCGLAI